MSELEQLKADLAAFERVRECSGKYGCIHDPDTIRCIAKIEARIKVLEAPPDPFREAKHLTEIQRKEKNHDFFLADYAIFLEDEVERLKAELAKASTIEPEFGFWYVQTI